MKSCDRVLDALYREQSRLVGRHVVAPLAGRGHVDVLVHGLVWCCRVTVDFHGWGLFRILATNEADLLREAHREERDAWAKGRPRDTLTLLGSMASGAWAAWSPTRRRALRVYLVEGLQAFDAVEAVFGNDRVWSLGPALTVDPRRAHRLRTAHADGVRPVDLDPAGLGADDPMLYAALHRAVPPQDRIRSALTLGGASLVSDVAHGDGRHTVTWRKGQHTHTSVVNADLSVASAGFCLSGTDPQHDLITLASLVGHSI